jgi:hypothetical protein
MNRIESSSFFGQLPWFSRPGLARRDSGGRREHFYQPATLTYQRRKDKKALSAVGESIKKRGQEIESLESSIGKR